ncbi:MAG TPA: alpha/beta fold hydrolase [Pyrinomonadaceae bacterium]|jgi:pimeloyl-ACP methyl ester carboxylesterase|nr:alpha/beta fold hydrolase [Pyrinomonadaceae bacterium]
MSVKQKFWKGLFVAGGAGVAALAAVNASIARGVRTETEDTSLGGEARAFASEHGSVYYRTAGAKGREPLVFLHDIGAGASSFMWRKNFDALATDFRVYAPDFLGFGLSDKPANVPYSADLYVALIRDFLVEGSRRAPAHLVAGGLSAAFAVRVADEHPALVRSLTLIAPTGAGASDSRPDLPGAAFYGLLHSPVLGESFYNAMTSERSLRDYARKRLFYERRFATERLVAHYYAASHQPGAQHAVAAFLSGYLNADMREAFARLTQPVTLVWGKDDITTPVAQADALCRLNPGARLEVFDQCRMTPQTEHAERFNELLRATLLARSAAA